MINISNKNIFLLIYKLFCYCSNKILVNTAFRWMEKHLKLNEPLLSINNLLKEKNNHLGLAFDDTLTNTYSFIKLEYFSGPIPVQCK